MFGHTWLIAVLILAIVLIVLGPGKLSELGGALGRAIRNFRQATDKSEADTSKGNKTSGEG